MKQTLDTTLLASTSMNTNFFSPPIEVSPYSAATIQVAVDLSRRLNKHRQLCDPSESRQHKLVTDSRQVFNTSTVRTPTCQC
jgi:hypothetical protein